MTLRQGTELPAAHPASLPPSLASQVLVLFPVGNDLRGPSAAAPRPAGLSGHHEVGTSLTEALLVQG